MVGHLPGDPFHRPFTTDKDKEKTMYDMYPEWGPAHLDEDHPANPANWVDTPVQESMDLRDNGGIRPDDS